ncbi:hypothetical protein HDU76_012536 [Blyttiomyces sp. JEL0837]|nr:hypothetical protein HDU76_012536 [Blyttiomyces sp. JEL0837]
MIITWYSTAISSLAASFALHASLTNAAPLDVTAAVTSAPFYGSPAPTSTAAPYYGSPAPTSTVSGGKSRPGTGIVGDLEMQDLREKCKIAEQAYCVGQAAFTAFNCVICDNGLTDIQSIVSYSGNYAGFAAVDKGNQTIYISFRGAILVPNYVAALNVEMADPVFPNYPSTVRVHEGFMKAYKSIRKHALLSIGAYTRKYPHYKIHAVGHSFGCVLSAFTVVDLVLQNMAPAKNISLTGFGCPRIGNEAWARMIDTKLKLNSVRRFVHSADVAAHYPPLTLQSKDKVPSHYTHFQLEYWLSVNAKTTYRCGDIDPLTGESPSCANTVPPSLWSVDAHTSYWDHPSSSACAPVEPSQPVTVLYLQYQIYKKQ